MAAYILSRLLTHMALRPWRKSEGKHWTQRASLLYTARVTAGLCVLLLPVDIYLALRGYGLQRGMPQVMGAGNICLILFCDFAGALLANESFGRKIYPDFNFKQFVRALFAVLLLRGSVLAVLGVTIFILPSNFGVKTWLEVAVALGVLLAMQYGLGRQILVWLRLLKPADDHLRKLVAETSERMKVRVANVWILQTVTANAYAFPVTQELMFTSTLLQRFSDDQITAICAHELGHLTESRQVRLARQINPLLFFPLVFINPVEHLTQNPFLYPAACFIAALGLKIAIMRLGRRMEVRADSIAIAQHAQPAVYALALEHLYQINQIPAAMGRRKSVHPDLYDRMIAAGLTPEYAKPRRPQRYNTWSLLLLFAFGALFALNQQSFDSVRYSSRIQGYRQWLRDNPNYRSAPDYRYPSDSTQQPANGPIQNIPLAPAPENGGAGRLQRILFFDLQPVRSLHYCEPSLKGRNL